MSISELPCSYCDRNADTYCGKDAMPCVNWGGTTIAEPATMLTDYAVAAAAGVSAGLLFIQYRNDEPNRNRRRCTVLWAAGLGLLAVSFAAAGTEHGFAVYTMCAGRDTCSFCSGWWIASMMLAVAAVATLVHLLYT